MKQVRWEVRNFSLGMHTDLARAGEGAEGFARHAAGVRVDENGHLRPRVPFRQFGELGESAITGVVAGANYLLYLRSDGSLWIRFADAPDDEREIRFGTPSDISGALSLVGDYADFLIIKGQGGHPYWVDMRPDSNSFLYANLLGLDPPTTQPNLAYLRSDDNNPAVIKAGFIYFYRWTYVRAIGDTPYKIRDGELQSVGTLFNGMESNPSLAIGVFRNLGEIEIRDKIIDGEGNPLPRGALKAMGGQFSYANVDDGNFITRLFRPTQLPEPYTRVFFDFQTVPPTDPQVTGYMLYQSEPVEALDSAGVTVNVDALQYKRIAYMPRTALYADTGPEAVEEQWAKKPPLRFDNDVMPASERIHLYHDRIFCPTDEGIHFSDIDGTILRLWAFPKTHAIRRSGVKDLVAHRGVLLFGGASDFHSLTGTSAFDFQVNRLGTLGPVSAHAMQVLRDSVAFAGASGFYVTDGVQVQKVSAPLDTEFEDYETVQGHCHQLPDESIVFIVQQRHDEKSPRRMTFHFDSGAWFSWPRFNIRQIAHWRVPGSRIMMADESHALRELIWKVTPEAADDSARDPEDWIEWTWQSQRLNFGTEDFKSFRELQLELQALSVIPQGEERWDINWGPQTVASSLTWRLGGKVLVLGGLILGTAEVPVPVRLTVTVDDKPEQHFVFEAQRESLRAMRIPINRTGRAITLKLEGRGHLQLRSLVLIGGMR